MKKVSLSVVKDDLSHFVHLAEGEEIVITRHGRPAAILIGFKDEDAWFEYKLLNDPRFIRRIEAAREDVRAGRTEPMEKVFEELGAPARSRRKTKAVPQRKRGAKTRRTA